MRPIHFALTAAFLALAVVARAEDPKKDSAAQPPVVRIGNLSFHRSTEDAFSRARKEGKLVFVYRMLGDLDGLT